MADILEWILDHPILALVIIYALACTIDLLAPVYDRGSWWNIAYWLLRLVCIA